MKRLNVVLVALLALTIPACAAKRPRAMTPDPTKVTDSTEKAAARGLAAEPAPLVGSIVFEVHDSHGRLKDFRELHNLVVDAGKAGIASRINGSGGEAAFTYIAIGTGTTSPVAGNTTLEAEIASGGGSRANGTCVRVTTDVTNDTAQCEVTYNITSTFAVTESGLFNASSSGVLLSRQTFSAINVINGDTLLIRWKIDVD